MSTEHPITVPIARIDLDPALENCFVVGFKGVTRIEATTKSGMHADIPYIRVWRGDQPVAEFCQHNIAGVYFAPPVSS